MSKAEDKLDLSRIVYIGRTYEEYMLMFNLSQEELTGRRILDCPAGACSLTAIANRLGIDVTAADIAYYYSIDELREKGFQDIEHAMQSMQHAQDNYIWDYYKTVDGLKNRRISALTNSLEGMKETPDKYVPATLPVLPFRDKEYDITLSAHFLFMYGDRLDYDFHLTTLQELMRVTRDEIRIFPIVDLANKRYEHLDKLLAYIHTTGWEAQIVEVPYEFQKNAKHMLKLTIM